MTKRIRIVLALLVSALLASQANAAIFTINLGDLSDDAGLVSATLGSGSFTQFVTFSLSESSQLTASSFFSSGIDAATTALGFVSDRTSLATPAATVLVDQATLAPGTYQLTLTGNILGAAGTYSLSLAATDATTTAPVPEASTYAMLLAGLGILALATRSRRQR